ncbi:ABC transporter ATP-binding protein, partial [bacterium]
VQGYATVGTIASFVNYSRQFSRPVNQIASLYNATQSAIAGAERVFELMDEPEESNPVEEEGISETFQALRGSVAFEGVSFSYVEQKPVLLDISFRAASGETIAIIGPTGSGKTTLINLLARFYDPDAGTIEVDGVSILNRKRQSLRSRIGVVLQDTWLFSASVMENIRYGRLDATDEEVMAAARMANAESFIHRMPQGYETPLSEEGSNLSQGQRQMIAIARAILANPEILILDEATSNVDTRTEVAIQSAMRSLMQGRTSFVIAHRLRTIINADRILVVHNGRIIESGTHSELLGKKGFYFDLYTRQFDAS